MDAIRATWRVTDLRGEGHVACPLPRVEGAAGQLVASVEGGRALGWVSAREPLTNYPVLQPHDEIVGGAVQSLGWVPQPMPGVAPDPVTQVLHAHVTPGAVWTDARSAIPLASPSAVGAAAYARGSGTLALDMNGRARGAAGGAPAARGTGASQLHLIC